MAARSSSPASSAPTKLRLLGRDPMPDGTAYQYATAYQYVAAALYLALPDDRKLLAAPRLAGAGQMHLVPARLHVAR